MSVAGINKIILIVDFTIKFTLKVNGDTILFGVQKD